MNQTPLLRTSLPRTSQGSSLKRPAPYSCILSGDPSEGSLSWPSWALLGSGRVICIQSTLWWKKNTVCWLPRLLAISISSSVLISGRTFSGLPGPPSPQCSCLMRSHSTCSQNSSFDSYHTPAECELPLNVCRQERTNVWVCMYIDVCFDFSVRLSTPYTSHFLVFPKAVLRI